MTGVIYFRNFRALFRLLITFIINLFHPTIVAACLYILYLQMIYLFLRVPLIHGSFSPKNILPFFRNLKLSSYIYKTGHSFTV